MTSEPRLNPRINSLDIGTRELRTINIYPLSAGQELTVVEIVATLITAMGDAQTDSDLNDIQIFEMFSSIIKDKITEILGFVTDPKDEVTIDEFDNHQLAEFLEILYNSNFDNTIKKFSGLWEKTKGLFPSPRSLPKSSGKQPTS